MVIYYSRFLPNNSSTTYPLRQLLQKISNFRWTAQCEAAFIRLIMGAGREKTLTPYEPTLPIILTRPMGLADILSHIIDGQEKPIAFASRS
ncbi:reverse transcriptase [Caerostris darwini]|uniref:Reverse transcriptase n=1 Tax=Caerostris darwini TaxID=1538125 RepID=A0AAV4VPR8_9ARAC|nr:reverse transcriptase [Caerostris darwini]